MTAMSRRAFTAEGIGLMLAPLAAETQQPGKGYRIGILGFTGNDE